MSRQPYGRAPRPGSGLPRIESRGLRSLHRAGTRRNGQAGPERVGQFDHDLAGRGWVGAGLRLWCGVPNQIARLIYRSNAVVVPESIIMVLLISAFAVTVINYFANPMSGWLYYAAMGILILSASIMLVSTVLLGFFPPSQILSITLLILSLIDLAAAAWLFHDARMTAD
jgi:hypothetical protein